MEKVTKFIILSLIIGLLATISVKYVPLEQEDFNNAPQRIPSIFSINDYEDHDPIEITDKSGFATYASRGDGSSGDPFYIEDYRFINNSVPCINITNVNDTYFVIQNCLFQGISGGTGIYIDSVNNSYGTIYNNTFQELDYGINILDSRFMNMDENIFANNFVGIYSTSSTVIDIRASNFTDHDTALNLLYSDFITIKGCTFDVNRLGLNVAHSSSLIIQENSLSNSSLYGISTGGESVNITYRENQFSNASIYQNSHNATIINNSFENGGLALLVTAIDELNNFTIVNNTVNDLPLYFSNGENHQQLSSAYGQIIVVNAWNITIENFYCSNTIIGITIHRITDIKISNSICSENSYGGIVIYNSYQCKLINSTIYSNELYGIQISSSMDIFLHNNTFIKNRYGIHGGNLEEVVISSNHLEGNSYYGINVYYPINVVIVNNTCASNSAGMYFASDFDDDSIIVTHNLVFNNSNTGIMIYGITECRIMYNQIINNSFHGITCERPKELHVHHNAFIDNKFTAMYPSQAKIVDLIVADPQVYWYDIVTGEGNYWSDLAGSYYRISGLIYYDPNPLLTNPFETNQYSVPSSPENLEAVVSGAGVRLSWIEPQANGGSEILRYNVYRGIAPDEYMLIGIALGTTFFDGSGQADITYYYMVTALNENGEGSFSEVVLQTFPEPLSTSDSSSTLSTAVDSTSTTILSTSQQTSGFLGIIIIITLGVLFVRRKRLRKILS